MVKPHSAFAPGKNPNSLANLKPWAKGVSGGNKAGSTGPMITPHIRRYAVLTLNQLLRLPLDRMTVAENIAVRLLIEAFQSGYEHSTNIILNRLDGMQKGDVSIYAEQGSDVRVALVWGNGDPATPKPEVGQ